MVTFPSDETTRYSAARVEGAGFGHGYAERQSECDSAHRTSESKTALRAIAGFDPPSHPAGAT
jgi:hypothetical protein